MSTRSTIAIHEDDKYRSIYCYRDGDNNPGGVGHMLKHYYNNVNSAQSIINLGALSYIEQNKVFAYHRDGGDPWKQCHPVISSTKEQLIAWAHQLDADYLYIFENGAGVAHKNKNGEFIPM